MPKDERPGTQTHFCNCRRLGRNTVAVLACRQLREYPQRRRRRNENRLGTRDNLDVLAVSQPPYRRYSREMRPLRYSINVTLDRCCDHRAIPADEDLHRYAVENLSQADALLFGRVTYEMMESAWRALARTEANPDWMESFAQTINAANKYGVSSTHGSSGGRTRPPALHERRERPATDGHGSRRRPACASESAPARETRARVAESRPHTQAPGVARLLER